LIVGLDNNRNNSIFGVHHLVTIGQKKMVEKEVDRIPGASALVH